MLHYYRVLYTTYNNEVKVGNTRGFTIADESEVKEETIPITWKNLEEVYHDHGLSLAFNLWHFKRGRTISFCDGIFVEKKLP